MKGLKTSKSVKNVTLIKKACLNVESKNKMLRYRRDAAGCVIVFAKSRTLELGDNDLRTL